MTEAEVLEGARVAAAIEAEVMAMAAMEAELMVGVGKEVGMEAVGREVEA
jgi:hypothetical protein